MNVESNTRKIKYFTVIGERCSGTHFIRYAMEWNFKLEYYPIFEKHFFGHNDSLFDTEKMKETLVICLFRKPIDWMDSYFKRLHQVPIHNKKNIFNYLNNEFYAIYEVPPNKGKDMENDYHITEKRRYHNIFELREVKNNYMLKKIPELVDNYMMLRYEDLRDSYEDTLQKIKDAYNLEAKTENFKKIIRYKGTYLIEYAKKPILIKPRYQDYILSKVNQDQEYFIENMDFFGKILV